MINKLVDKIKKTNAPIVVGLDPMLSYVPEHITKKAFDELGETPAGAAEAIWHRLHTPQDISERYRSAARAILPLMRILPLSIHTLEQTVSSHS